MFLYQRPWHARLGHGKTRSAWTSAVVSVRCWWNLKKLSRGKVESVLWKGYTVWLYWNVLLLLHPAHLRIRRTWWTVVHSLLVLCRRMISSHVSITHYMNNLLTSKIHIPHKFIESLEIGQWGNVFSCDWIIENLIFLDAAGNYVFSSRVAMLNTSLTPWTVSENRPARDSQVYEAVEEEHCVHCPVWRGRRLWTRTMDVNAWPCVNVLGWNTGAMRNG